MWFDKNHPDAIYTDIRTYNDTLCDGRQLVIDPDILADFRELPFDDETFYLVVLDPPHLHQIGKNTWLAAKYGSLLPTWETDIRGGVEEAMRVLKPNGVLIFKWNEIQIPLAKVLSVIPYQPLFGHTSGKHGKTIWLTFMKS